jgi:hypothetical protein
VHSSVGDSELYMKVFYLQYRWQCPVPLCGWSGKI